MTTFLVALVWTLKTLSEWSFCSVELPFEIYKYKQFLQKLSAVCLYSPQSNSEDPHLWQVTSIFERSVLTCTVKNISVFLREFSWQSGTPGVPVFLQPEVKRFLLFNSIPVIQQQHRKKRKKNRKILMVSVR